MKTGFLITGRLKSTRLEKKLLLEVEGKSFIYWMIKRIQLSELVNKIILCTSTNSQDDPLEQIAGQLGIQCFRGDEEDVVSRLNKACKKYALDYSLNITADCPLVSYEYIDETVKAFIDTGADLIRSLQLPHGMFLYGIKPKALDRICQLKKDSHTEVWGRYFTENQEFDVIDLEIPKELIRSDFRLTLDYPEDYEFFKEVYNHFGKSTFSTPSPTIIKYLDANPEIPLINKHCKELYKKRWDSQNNYKV